ncbi:H-NS family nucleoid-associated regulatory protein [Simplicispira suum]|uniref:Histone n=1 Tax=Simplicispira suum TaxID=2109915 RepID=A0A2S0N5W8_9BURK|nr:H-NS histone family protein [Simplicispira suum]AVO43427.1 histone [Simplicispira suum]
MAKSYKELMEERNALDVQIAQARKEEISAAVTQARSIISQFELTATDIFGGPRSSKIKAAPKYRDPQTGKVWTGRGREPSWIAGKDRAQFAIAQVS